jgi:hypothetical protein
MMLNFKIPFRTHHRVAVLGRSDNFAEINATVFGFESFFQMNVNGIIIVTIMNDNHVAVTFKPARVKNLAPEDGSKRFPFICFYIDAAAEVRFILLLILIRLEQKIYSTFYGLDKQAFMSGKVKAGVIFSAGGCIQLSALA